MKNRIAPTSVEKVMREGDFIVSKTDTKGRITYGNKIFIEFSGYTEKELLGAQHNIIRHPDMPRAVFKLLWDTITKKEECWAYVKNMSKDGSFYWVLANITPSINEQGDVFEYLSVRRKPSAGAVAAVQDLYHAMLIEETKAGPRNAIDASTKLLVNALATSGKGYDEFILSI